MPRFDDLVIYRPDIYHPPNKGLTLYLEQHNLHCFTVDFERNSIRDNAILYKFFELVRDVIARMSVTEQQAESEKFFVYLISDPRRDIGAYLQPLLDYFHMLGFLKFKKNIYNDNKQSVVRYQVVFKNKQGKIIKQKRYASLAQLSDDIGKKMTSLHYQLFKVKN